MTLIYETITPQFDAEHECEIKLDGETLEIHAGYRTENYVTITLEQFDAIAKDVADYRKMVAIANGKGGEE